MATPTATQPVALTDAWKKKALSSLRAFARTRVGQRHVAETIRKFAEDRGVPQLKDARAWGHVFKKAEREGVIKRVGYAPTVSSNGSPKALWKMLRCN